MTKKVAKTFFRKNVKTYFKVRSGTNGLSYLTLMLRACAFAPSFAPPRLISHYTSAKHDLTKGRLKFLSIRSTVLSHKLLLHTYFTKFNLHIFLL